MLQPATSIIVEPLFKISTHFPSGKFPVVFVDGKYSVMNTLVVRVGKYSMASMLVILIVGYAEICIASLPLTLESEKPGSFVVQFTSSPIEPFGQ